MIVLNIGVFIVFFSGSFLVGYMVGRRKKTSK